MTWARSVVAASIGARPVEMLNGLIISECKEDHSDFVEMWFDKSLTADGFFWKIPRGASTEYGCMGRGLSFTQLQRFFHITPDRKIQKRAAPIPVGPPEKTSSGRILLIGDAAGQTKPWSGGGLAYGLIAASCAAEALKKSVAGHPEALSGYDRCWRKMLMRDIQAGLLAREFYKDLDLDGIAGMMSKIEGAERGGSDIDFDFPFTSILGSQE